MATSQLLCDTLETPCCSQKIFPPAGEGFAWYLGTIKSSPESSPAWTSASYKLILETQMFLKPTFGGLDHHRNSPFILVQILGGPAWGEALQEQSTICAQVRGSPGSGERKISAIPTPELRHQAAGRWCFYKVMGINTRMGLNPAPTASALGLPGYFTLNLL